MKKEDTVIGANITVEKDGTITELRALQSRGVSLVSVAQVAEYFDIETDQVFDFLVYLGYMEKNFVVLSHGRAYDEVEEIPAKDTIPLHANTLAPKAEGLVFMGVGLAVYLSLQVFEEMTKYVASETRR